VSISLFLRENEQPDSIGGLILAFNSDQPENQSKPPLPATENDRSATLGTRPL
jgi:hypothetical protein